jgi:diguanylate cyclase (GGDEF)-like protein/PAS domain S-box-containing protein
MLLVACLSIGVLYYFFALIGVHYLSLPTGIVVFWPPNAALLAAFLTLPRRYWPGLAGVVIIAEVLADYSSFPIDAAVLFGLINVAECALAAIIIKRFGANKFVQPEWTEPRELALFTLVVFFVASPIAALAGASVYSYLLLEPAPFIVFWRLWWFGDATGLIVLTPALHMLFNFRVYWPDARYLSAGVVEWVGLIVTTFLTCFLVFSTGIMAGPMLAMTPLLVMLAPLWAALRLGPLPGSALAAVVVVYASIATATGHAPFELRSPLVIQEVIVLFIVIVLFTAAFNGQSRRKSGSLRLYKSAVEATGDGVLITEAESDQPIIYCNESFSTMTGYREEEILGHNCRFLNRNEPDQPAVSRIRAAIERNEAIRITVRNFRKDGSLFWNNLVINPIRDARGRTTHFVGIVRDISQEIEHHDELENLLDKLRESNETLEEQVLLRTKELEEANRDLKRLALTDELTGVNNRRNLISRGHREVLRCSRSGDSFSVMLLDIDHFKRFNDQHGHEVGDLVLKAFATAVRQTIRKVDSFGRWGGEEFMILVSDSQQVDLRVIGEKVLRSIRACKIVHEGRELHVTASMGVATWHSGSFDQTVQLADRALYKAKELGRDQLYLY